MNSIRHLVGGPADEAAARHLANVDRAEDKRDFTTVIVGKPWGYEYLYFENPNVAIWLLRIDALERTSMHSHPNKTTYMVVLSGEVEVQGLNSGAPLSERQAIQIPAGTFHQTTATSEGGAFIMEIETPNDKFDLMRLNDSYGREKKGYESSKSDMVRNSNHNFIDFDDRAGNSGSVTKIVSSTSVHITVCPISELKNNVESLPAEALVFILDSSPEFAGNMQRLWTVRDFCAENSLHTEGTVTYLAVSENQGEVTGAQALGQELVRLGVTKIFAAQTDTNFHLVEAVGRNEGLQLELLANSSVAAHAALGYAAFSGQVGVVLVGGSVSAMRVMDAVAISWTNSLPLIVLATEGLTHGHNSSSARQLGNKHVRLTEMIQPITKAVLKVSAATEVVSVLQTAFNETQSKRPGPIWIDLELSAQTAFTYRHETWSSRTQEFTDESHEDFGVLYENLKLARRPVLLVGRGAQSACASGLVQEFAASLQIPIVTTRSGMDCVSSGFLLNFGRCGAYGQRAANFIVQNSDFVLSLGSSLGTPLVGRNPELFAREARLCVVDIDSDELNKSYLEGALLIQEDVRKVIQEGLKYFKAQAAPISVREWISECIELRRELAQEPEWQIDATDQFASVYAALLCSSRYFPEECVIVLDGDWITHVATQVMIVLDSQRVILDSGLESGDFALRAALGCSLAASELQDVVVICDNKMNSEEIEALKEAASQGAPIKVIVIDVADDSAVDVTKRWTYPGSTARFDASPNIKSVAQSLKIPIFEVDKPEDMLQIRDRFFDLKGTAVLMVKVLNGVDLTPRPSFLVDSIGQWQPLPIEDLAPLLPMEQLKKFLRPEISEVSEHARK